MIAALMIAAFLETPAPVQPDFAFVCNVVGTSAPNGDFKELPEQRPLAVLVHQDKGGSATPVQTVDPSQILGGRKFGFFQKSENDPGYGAYTSDPLQDEDALLMAIAPPDSATNDQWKMVIGSVKNSAFEQDMNAGFCQLKDGLSEAEFEQIAPKIEKMK